ncbi:restriction endonuclease subunit R, partial [Staphylococcus equorum]
FNIAPTPKAASDLEREDDKKEFVLAFRELGGLLLRLKTFDQFQFSEEHIGIGEQTFEDYKSVYFNLYDEGNHREPTDDGESVLDDIDFKVELLRNDLINVQYILDLLASIDLTDEADRDHRRRQIHQLLDKADDEQLRLKADLIRKFLDKVIPTLATDADINEAYYDYEEQEKVKEVQQFAESKEYSSSKLLSIIGEYEYSGILDRAELQEGIKG